MLILNLFVFYYQWILYLDYILLIFANERGIRIKSVYTKFIITSKVQCIHKGSYKRDTN